MEAEIETSEDAVLGGRLRLRQPLRGHRVGHDAILLAAATGARAGEHAIDLGAGVGAAGLALAVRVAGLKVTLVDLDFVLCALATYNARLNRLDDRVQALALDVESANALERGGLTLDSADRVLMNSAISRRAPAKCLARSTSSSCTCRRAWASRALGRYCRVAFEIARCPDAHLASRWIGRGIRRARNFIWKYSRPAGAAARRRTRHPHPGASREGR